MTKGGLIRVGTTKGGSVLGWRSVQDSLSVMDRHKPSHPKAARMGTMNSTTHTHAHTYACTHMQTHTHARAHT